ncbi:hypothetical protein [Streptomyces tsukubensis]|uniref:hypothetical protein n=1 Tax=Streptomyces tsukubensis TaxID=83656 RepID=UPI00344DA999
MEMQTWRDARSKAVDATEAIRAAMAAIGLPEAFWSSLRPVVTHSGKSYVNVGMVPAEAAEQIAEAMRTTRNGTP